MNLMPLPHEEFLAALEREGRIPADAVQRARQACRKTGQAVDIVLRELGILHELDIARGLAGFIQASSLSAVPASESDILLERIGFDFAAEKAIVPVRIEDGYLHLVVADPFNTQSLDAVSYFFDLPARLEIAPRTAIEEYLRQAKTAPTDFDPDDDMQLMEGLDLERLQDIARDAPVVRFVARIIQKAVDEKATDIHLEPTGQGFRVRFRRDGMLSEVENAAAGLHAGVISRVKILARLNIAERRLPQDGRLRLPVRGQEVDFRISVMPSVHGETVVLRILDRESVALDLRSLGYDEAAAAKIRAMTHRPNGLVLVTGPTGSGKTTTLYSMLADLNRPNVKIFTVEDPVEYRMAGITQLQVNAELGLTFATALRSVLRQDPDIILVGEIRDRETAEIAVQAALTGHLVLSTLHTNDAVGSFSRLRDMGIEPFLLEATVRGVIAQRLVRQCCVKCRGKGNGDFACTSCGGSGFKGRRATYEILEISEGLRDAIVSGAQQDVLHRIAREDGMVRMRDHAFALATTGATTHAEAIRVIDMDAA